MKCEIINTANLGKLNSDEEIQAYLVELERNFAGWTVDFVETMEKDIEAIENFEKEVDLYKKNDDGVYIKKSEGLTAYKYYETFNNLESFKIHLSDYKKFIDSQIAFQEPYYSKTKEEFQEKLFIKFRDDINLMVDYALNEKKKGFNKKLEFYNDERKRFDFINEECERLKSEIVKNTYLPIPRNIILSNLDSGLKAYFSNDELLYEGFQGIKFSWAIEKGGIAIGAGRFMLVRPEEGLFNSLYFDFSNLDREKELIKYITKVMFHNYLEKMELEITKTKTSSEPSLDTLRENQPTNDENLIYFIKDGKQVKSAWDYANETGLMEHLTKNGITINPTHNFELLKQTRLDKLDKLKIKFIEERKIAKVETTSLEMDAFYYTWLKYELTEIERWLSKKLTVSEQIEITKYKNFIDTEKEKIEIKNTVEHPNPPQQTESIDWIILFDSIDIEHPIKPKAYITNTIEQKQNFFSEASFNLTIQYLTHFKKETYLLSKKRKLDYIDSLNIVKPVATNTESPLLNQTIFEAQNNYFEFLTLYKGILENLTPKRTDTKPEHFFSVLEWATIFYYADESKLLSNSRYIKTRMEQFIKKHDINTTPNHLKTSYYEAKKRINIDNNFPIEKLELIIPFIKKNYKQALTKIENDKIFLKENITDN